VIPEKWTKVHQNPSRYATLKWRSCQISLCLAINVREKRYKNFYTLQYFADPGDPLGQRSAISAPMYSKYRTNNMPNFVAFWQPIHKISAAEHCWFRWKHDRQKTINNMFNSSTKQYSWWHDVEIYYRLFMATKKVKKSLSMCPDKIHNDKYYNTLHLKTTTTTWH